LALAIVRLCLGLVVLWWMIAYGVHDESSLGTVFFTCGSLLALLLLVAPAVVTLIRAPRR